MYMISCNSATPHKIWKFRHVIHIEYGVKQDGNEVNVLTFADDASIEE